MTTVLCATNHEFYEDQPLNFDAAAAASVFKDLPCQRIFRKQVLLSFSEYYSLVFTISKVVSCNDAVEKPLLRVVPSDL